MYVHCTSTRTRTRTRTSTRTSTRACTSTSCQVQEQGLPGLVDELAAVDRSSSLDSDGASRWFLDQACSPLWGNTGLNRWFCFSFSCLLGITQFWIKLANAMLSTFRTLKSHMLVLQIPACLLSKWRIIDGWRRNVCVCVFSRRPFFLSLCDPLGCSLTGQAKKVASAQTGCSHDVKWFRWSSDNTTWRTWSGNK